MYDLEQEFECYAAVVQVVQLQKDIYGIMADLPSLVKTVSAGASTLQKLADIAMQTQNLELKEGILSVREELINIKEALLDVRAENLDLKDENQALKRRIAKLETMPQNSDEMKPQGKFYYTQNGRGPYCPQCWEGKNAKTLISDVGGLKVCSIGCGYKTL